MENHYDNISKLQILKNKKQLELQSRKISNQRYEEVRALYDGLNYEIQLCNEDLTNHIKALSVLEGQYQKMKDSLKKDLEKRLTDTINLWYNENVKLEFVYRGTSAKDKRKSVRLIDVNKGVPLEGITGDAACQTIGLLVSVCMAKMRGLSFLFYDEPFSNFNDVSASKVPDLLKSIITDMQIVVIENKETVLNELESYTVVLDKEMYNKKKVIHNSIVCDIENKNMYVPVTPTVTEGDLDEQ